MRMPARALVATLAIAAMTHVAVLWAVPRVIMGRTIAVMDGLGARNAAVHPPPATDRARRVVMPSPDLLYTLCSFNLGEKPLRVSAAIPAGTYWSVAFFADDTDNFFTLDDRMAQAPHVAILLVGPGGSAAPAAGMRVIRSPTRRGIVLFRTLVTRAADLPALRRAQQDQRCDPVD